MRLRVLNIVFSYSYELYLLDETSGAKQIFHDMGAGWGGGA